MDAAERWHVLRLHVEDQIPLAVLAREIGISARTLQRWRRWETRPAVADHSDGRLLPRDLRVHGLHRCPLSNQHCSGPSAGDLAKN
nr:helix-turn-helix domain-containing protein [Cryobacterium sp. Hb1]